MKQAQIFSEFDRFYGFFEPLTPYGKKAKGECVFFTSPEELEKEFDLTEDFLAFLDNKRFQADKLEFHLKQIPLLAQNHSNEPGSAEIFLYKRFLTNAKAIFGVLPQRIKKALGVNWSSDKLLDTLLVGGAGDSFHLAGAYSAELAEIRKKLGAAAEKLSRQKLETIKRLAETCSLDFSRHDFLIIEEAAAKKIYNSPELFFEPYDSFSICVKPVFGQQYLELSASIEKLRVREQAEERSALKMIYCAIKEQNKEIAAYRDALEKTDVLLAKARLAVKFGMTRPKLKKFPAPPVLQKARLISMELKLKEQKLKYTPLSFKFIRHVNILRGSNMGGKTAALKTIAFMQLLTQSGFFVPAESYETSVYENIHIIGTLDLAQAEGLSGFGIEIRSFCEAYQNTRRSCLIFMDEFAKTTNADEASALLSAIIEDFSENEKTVLFSATHFTKLASHKNAAFLKMKGFDSASYDTYFAEHPGADQSEKLRMLNKFMNYAILPDSSPQGARDAIKIANILGLNAGIVKRAEEILTHSEPIKEKIHDNKI